MATEELVTEQFQFLGIEVENDVLSKCVSLCREYDIDAESFVEQWMAFSLTHLKGAAPSLEHLELLERKEFSKRADVLTPCKNNTRSAAGSGLTVYGAANSVESDNGVLSNYAAAAPKAFLRKRVLTDDGQRSDPKRIPFGRVKVEVDTGSNQQNELCPATYSPSVSYSAKYSSRINAGAVVHSFGDEALLQNVDKVNCATAILNLNITQVPNHDGQIFTKAMFGFELLHEKANAFDNHINYLSQCIMKKAKVSEEVSVRHKSQSEVYASGRIDCDADARLNPKCAVLQGDWRTSLSQNVPLDLDSLAQYSLFPGQVVVMGGTNPRGDKFIASQVFHDAALPLTDHRADINNTLTGTMSLVVAAGPYTTSDSMSYEPLKDLVTHIAIHKPHVVIVTGPFMDCEHAKVKDYSMAESYNTYFDKLLDNLGELNSLSPLTKIYIVSSSREAFHINVYPTLAYPNRKKHPNIHFVPDPCTLNINGVIVGVTSTDVLMHIGQEEISSGAGGDKLSRLAGHLLSQQSYYPLHPAPPALLVDAELWAAHAQMSFAPHVLLLPSNFRYFVKDVNGCVVVNPERLAKGTGGGTFAKLLISGGEKLNVAAHIVRI